MKTIRMNTREAIIEAAFEVFAEKPGASLSDVADRAGVGRATLHRQFDGRQDLMRVLHRLANAEMDDAIAKATDAATSYTEGLKLALEAMVPLGNRQWFLSFQSVQFEDEPARDYAAGLKTLETAFEAAKLEGAFREDVPTHWLVQAYENLVFAAWTSVKQGDSTPKQAANLAWQTLIEGNGVKRK